MPHPALIPGSVAVITGGAAGIGLACATRFARLGLRVCIADIGADLGPDRLAEAARLLAEAAPDGADAVFASETDVADRDAVRGLEAAVAARFGGTDVLVNNAGIQPGSAMFGGETWDRILAVNLGGIIDVARTFVPGMVARGRAMGRAGLVINTGSKQGITNPPGDPAYNVAKAGVKAFTELLQHELRGMEGCRVSAHLLIPGFVFTGLTARGRTQRPEAAWTPDQVADFMLKRLDHDDFYILCPDNDVPRTLDERRILWAAGDLVENRPALSRWDPAHAEAFTRFVDGGSGEM